MKDAHAIKRKRFVHAYLGDANGNATQAAIHAGYSPHTAKQQGSALLTRPDVAKAIQTHVGKADLSTEQALQRVATIAQQQPPKGYTGNDVLKANELILKVNGALSEAQTQSRITVNIGFLQAQTGTVHLSTSQSHVIDAETIDSHRNMATDMASLPLVPSGG